MTQGEMRGMIEVIPERPYHSRFISYVYSFYFPLHLKWDEKISLISMRIQMGSRTGSRACIYSAGALTFSLVAFFTFLFLFSFFFSSYLHCMCKL